MPSIMAGPRKVAMRGLCRVLVGVCVIALPTLALASGAPQPHQRSRRPVDRLGRPVVTASGERITYGPGERLEARRSRFLGAPRRSSVLPRTPHLSSSPLVVSEWQRVTFGNAIGESGLY